MKAFDKVPHLRLIVIHKLEKYQITGQFSGWIRSQGLGASEKKPQKKLYNTTRGRTHLLPFF